MAVASNSAAINFTVNNAWESTPITHWAIWDDQTTRSATTLVVGGQFPAPLSPPTQAVQEVKFDIGGLKFVLPRGAFQPQVAGSALADDDVTGQTLYITLHTGAPGTSGNSEVTTMGGYDRTNPVSIAANQWTIDNSLDA